MKMKLFIIIIGLLVILVNPVSAIDCNLFADKANQYRLENEQINQWGSITINQNSYCIFEYNPKSSDISPIIMINEKGSRETSNLNQIAFSYFSGEFLRQNGNSIKLKYKSVYDSLSDNAEKYGNEKLTLIATAVKTAVDIADFCITEANIKICIGETAKDWLFNKGLFGYSNVKTWHEVLKNMGDTIFLTDRLQEKNINYQSDLKRYYENMGSIRIFIKEVDNKIGTKYFSNIESFDLIEQGKLFAENSAQIQIQTDSRKNKKLGEINLKKDKIKLTLSILSENISSLEKINADDEEVKGVYCKSQAKIRDENLISNEMYEKYKNELNEIGNEVNNAISNSKTIFELKSKNSNFFDGIIGFFRNVLWNIFGKTC